MCKEQTKQSFCCLGSYHLHCMLATVTSTPDEWSNSTLTTVCPKTLNNLYIASDWRLPTWSRWHKYKYGNIPYVGGQWSMTHSEPCEPDLPFINGALGAVIHSRYIEPIFPGSLNQDFVSVLKIPWQKLHVYSACNISTTWDFLTSPEFLVLHCHSTW